MATAKKNDFVEVEYTGKLLDEDIIFDTTDEKIGKETGLTQNITDFGPITINLGLGMLLKGLEEELIGKEIGKEYEIKLSPEKGFGKKNAQLIKMIPAIQFKKHNINPQPGMQVNIDGMMGIIKTNTGGRCMVDLNHPLSGKELLYKVKMNKFIEDEKEKVESILKYKLGIKKPFVNVKDGIVEIQADKEVPKEIEENFASELKEIIPTIKDVNFVVKKKEAKK